MPRCLGMSMAALYEAVIFVKDGSLEVTSVTELTPEFVTGRGVASPIVDDRDECGDDQLCFDPSCCWINPSAVRKVPAVTACGGGGCDCGFQKDFPDEVRAIWAAPRGATVHSPHALHSG